MNKEQDYFIRKKIHKRLHTLYDVYVRIENDIDSFKDCAQLLYVMIQQLNNYEIITDSEFMYLNMFVKSEIDNFFKERH